MEQFRSINPATGALIATYRPLGAAEIDERLATAASAFERWRQTPLAERTALLVRVAGLLEERRETYARLMTDEMGKLLGDARAEVTKCATACRHYAEHAGAMLAPETVPTEM